MSDESNSIDSRTSQFQEALANSNARNKRHHGNRILQPYVKFARFYTRSENLFTNWHDVLEAGLQWEVRDYGDLSKDQFEQEHKMSLSAYKRLVSSVVQFKEDIYRLQDDPVYIQDLVRLLNDAAAHARSEDISVLLERSIKYVTYEQPGRNLVPPLDSAAPKKDFRGHNHVVLSRLLCPAKYLSEFDRDPDVFRRKLLNGTVKVFPGDLPAMLYENADYDPDDVECGLFRNGILLRVFKCIFTAPSSALDENFGHGRTKAPQAQLNNMKTVTPGSIMYAAVLLRHSLSAVSDWRCQDKLFDKQMFFAQMSSFFDDMDDEWVRDTLNWWNQNVFPNSNGIEDEESDTPNFEPSTASIAKAQRRRRIAASSQGTSRAANSSTSSASGTASQQPAQRHRSRSHSRTTTTADEPPSQSRTWNGMPVRDDRDRVVSQRRRSASPERRGQGYSRPGPSRQRSYSSPPGNNPEDDRDHRY